MPTAPPRPPLARVRSFPRRLRRLLLRRRRLLAALCALVAVLAGLRATAAPPPPSVLVTVAARDLGAGARLAPGDLVEVAFAPGTVPDARVRHPVGRTLATPLTRGSPVTEAGLLGPALVEGHPDLVAVPVRLPDTAVATLLRPGDRVDVVAADPQGGPTVAAARDALVLALPPPPPDAAADGLPGRLVVLGVPETDVTELATAPVSHFLTIAWSR